MLNVIIKCKDKHFSTLTRKKSKKSRKASRCTSSLDGQCENTFIPQVSCSQNASFRLRFKKFPRFFVYMAGLVQTRRQRCRHCSAAMVPRRYYGGRACGGIIAGGFARWGRVGEGSRKGRGWVVKFRRMFVAGETRIRCEAYVRHTGY